MDPKRKTKSKKTKTSNTTYETDAYLDICNSLPHPDENIVDDDMFESEE